MARMVELVIVIIGMLIPQFILASEVDGDEFAKSMSGVAFAGSILAAYKVWKTRNGRSNGKSNEST